MDVSKATTAITLLLFALSLCFTAFKVEDLGGINDYKSFLVFLIGPISFLGGGIFEFFIWSANIWFFTSMVFNYKRKYIPSLLFGILALITSISFFFYKEVLVSESGRLGKIYSLETGYFIWIASISFVTISSFYASIQSRYRDQKISS